MATDTAGYDTRELTPEEVDALLQRGGLDLGAVLAKNLWDGRTFMRRNAALALSRAGKLEGLSLVSLPVATKDVDPLVRKHAVAAVARAGIPITEVVEILFRSLCDADPLVSESALQETARLVGADPGTMVVFCVAGLEDPRPFVAATARELCHRMGTVATPHLVRVLNHEQPQVVAAAYQTLEQLGDVAAPALVTALVKDGAVRRRAARLLMGLGALDKGPRASLEALASAADAALAELAKRILTAGEKQPEPPLVFPVPGFTERLLSQVEIAGLCGAGSLPPRLLLRSLSDGRVATRANAAQALGQLAHAEAVDALGALVRDPALEVRRAAVWALGQTAAGAVARPLVTALGDADPEVRALARQAIAALGPSFVGAIVTAAEASGDGAEAEARMALLGAKTPVAEPLGALVTEAPRAPVRALAASILTDLGELGRPAIGSLLHGLRDEVDSVRVACAIALGRLKEAAEDVLEALTRATNDRTPAVRQAAFRALAEVQGLPFDPLPPSEPETVPIPGFDADVLGDDALGKAAARKDVPTPLLMRALRDGRWARRANAASLLGLRGGTREAAVSLTALARDPVAQVRRAAVTSLGQLDTETTYLALVQALDDADAAVRTAAEKAVAGVAKGSAGALVNTAARADREPQRVVVEILANAGAAAARALGELVSSAPLVDVRVLAARALGAQGAAGAPGAAGLVAAMEHAAEEVRAACARALGRQGLGADTVVAALERAAQERARSVRLAALRALSEVGGMPGAAGALSSLNGRAAPVALDPREPPAEGFVTGACSDAALKAALKAVGPQGMAAWLRDGRAPARENATRAMGLAGKTAEAWVQVLTVALKDADPAVRAAAAQALGRVQGAPEIAVPALAGALPSSPKAVATAILEALDAFGKAAVAPLLGLLSDRPERCLAVGAAARRAPALYLKPLIELLEHGEPQVVVENAIDALGALGPAGRPAEAALLALASGTQGLVFVKAVSAVAEVGEPAARVRTALVALVQGQRADYEAAAVRAALQRLK
jgi:HEAT repeat protein